MLKPFDPVEFNEWLTDKPDDWKAVLTVRIALRALPFMGRKGEAKRPISQPVSPDLFDVDWLKQNSIQPFRAVLIAWSAINVPSLRISREAEIAAIATENLGDPAAPYSPYSFAAYSASYTQTEISPLNTDAQNAFFTATQYFDAYAEDFSTAVLNDCKWLDEHSNDRSSSRVLSRRSLWLGKSPVGWRANWLELAVALDKIDTNFVAWTDWYARRIKGERAAFEIPGDRYRVEDKTILRRLAEAKEDNFWDQNVEHVNATLLDWLTAARERSAQGEIEQEIVKQEKTRQIIDDLASETQKPAPKQNPNALTFGRDDNDKIQIDTTAGRNALRNDPDSQDRHRLSMEEARELLKKCETSNAGARLTQLLKNYIEAGGEQIEDMRPSLYVQRGEKLRQETAAYSEPDNMLNPISDELLVDLKGWKSAHNMNVALQPKLNALDTAQLGPDAQPALFPPDDLRRIGQEAQEAEILADGVLEIVEETADIAPAIPDATNRLTIWSVETGKNLVIEAFAFAMNSPGTAGGGAVGTGVVLSEPATALVAGFGVVGFLMANRDWIESNMGNYPTWKSLFEQLCDLLERSTPPEP